MLGQVSSVKGNRTHTNVTVTTTAALLVAANGNRKSVTIQNQGSVTVYLGKEDVTTTGATRGFALLADHTFTDNASNGLWWAVAASSTAVVHVIEVK